MKKNDTDDPDGWIARRIADGVGVVALLSTGWKIFPALWGLIF